MTHMIMLVDSNT